jgi:hypothetical protein
LLHAFTGLAALFGETVATLSVWSATLLNPLGCFVFQIRDLV